MYRWDQSEFFLMQHKSRLQTWFSFFFRKGGVEGDRDTNSFLERQRHRKKKRCIKEDTGRERYRVRQRDKYRKRNKKKRERQKARDTEREWERDKERQSCGGRMPSLPTLKRSSGIVVYKCQMMADFRAQSLCFGSAKSRAKGLRDTTRRIGQRLAPTNLWLIGHPGTPLHVVLSAWPESHFKSH